MLSPLVSLSPFSATLLITLQQQQQLSSTRPESGHPRESSLALVFQPLLLISSLSSAPESRLTAAKHGVVSLSLFPFTLSAPATGSDQRVSLFDVWMCVPLLLVSSAKAQEPRGQTRTQTHAESRALMRSTRLPSSLLYSSSLLVPCLRPHTHTHSRSLRSVTLTLPTTTATHDDHASTLSLDPSLSFLAGKDVVESAAETTTTTRPE